MQMIAVVGGITRYDQTDGRNVKAGCAGSIVNPSGTLTKSWPSRLMTFPVSSSAIARWLEIWPETRIPKT